MGLSAILSNPPFHVGVHTDYFATENLLRKAAKHLKNGGELRLVANSFLKYQPLIEEHLGVCAIKAEGRVSESTGPSAAENFCLPNGFCLGRIRSVLGE
jgi:hypothetical protein